MIEDMLSWLRFNSVHKPLIWCNTVPVQSDWSLQNENVSKFCENIRKRYGVKNYVWVREYTGGGRPHYHFVGDSPFWDAIEMSRYWSGLFGEKNVNSIRLGTRPMPGHKRKFFINSNKMARYLSKYLGKAVGDNEKKSERKIRTFGHSQEVAKKSAPIVYESNIEYVKKEVQAMAQFNPEGYKYPGHVVKMIPENSFELVDRIERKFSLCENSSNELIEVYGNIPDDLKEFDDSNYRWFIPPKISQLGHKIYFGTPKKMQKAGIK